MTLDIGFVGTGADPDDRGQDGYAMAYKHAAGYERLDDCRLTACADIVPENARAFADHFGIGSVYDDYVKMVTEHDLDIVSVCVPPRVHAEVVVDLARHGQPTAIHCEKPMAHTWADCQRMVEVCDSQDVQLTINHQRRLGPTYCQAKQLLDSGKIGDLQRVEVATGNLYDAGSHLFDLCGMFTDQMPVDWVLAGLDYREENVWFGAHNENQALAQWRYEDGTYGLASTGVGEDGVGAYVRLIGENGRIEIGASDGPPLRIRHGWSPGWRAVDTGENIWGDHRPGLIGAGIDKLAPKVPVGPDDPFEYPSHIDRAIESVVSALREGTEPELRAANALQATEVIFASWESVRQRGRVDLPLEIEDNPLEAMVEAGMLDVSPESGEVSPAGDDD